MMHRDEAFTKFKEYGPDAYLLQHSQDSETIMRALASHFQTDQELWGLAGLLHDVDFPLTKDNLQEHGSKAVEILQGWELPEEVVYAIAAHNGEMSGKEPKSRLDFALRAAETVTGLISAAAKMRPTGMQGMEPKSLKKKMKDKSFAAAVSRERIRECEKIDLSLDEFLSIAIGALSQKQVA